MINLEELRSRVLVLALIGRDGPAAADVLRRAGLHAEHCVSLSELIEEMKAGVGTVVIAEEALFGHDLGALAKWIEQQPPWSDLPFVLLASHVHQAAITVWRQSTVAILRNVSLLERPIQALTLSSTVQTAVRARLRQYQISDLLESQQRSAQDLERLVVARTQQLANANAELVREMNERMRIEESLRQAQKIEAVGQLTGGVAHDFNNLLMVILAGLDMLSRDRKPERREMLIDGMRRAAERGANLIRQLLAFSRRQPLQPRPVDLNAQLAGMRELLDRSLRPDIQLEVHVAADLWAIEVDPGELELVILNLIVNARDAIAELGHIEIRAQNVRPSNASELEGEFVCLSISDSGTGMSEQVKQHVFEPFFTTKEVGKGSGLGLAQVYGFAKQSGGTVKIESELGKGTTVKLYLPRSMNLPAVEAIRTTVLDKQESSSKFSGSVLLVEDNDEVAVFVAQMLTQLGYDVIRVANASAALGALANGRDVDVVFTDIVMPGGMDGIELFHEVRARRPSMPVLLTSGYADALKDCEADYDVLRKPYRMDDLADALENAMGKARA